MGPIERPRADFDPPLTACPLCGAARPAHFDRDLHGVTIDRCGRCGVKFMNPQYTDAALAEFYARYIPPGDPHADAAVSWARGAEKAERVTSIERFRPAGGRFLSIGTGDGVELEAARARGYEVVGYDVDPATTAAVAARLGVEIWSGDLFARGVPDASFDVIYLDQVLEHPKNPAEYLRFAHRVLRPGGMLYVGVPNIESVSHQYQTALGRAGLKPRRGRHYDTWHHLFYYGPRTLRTILEDYHGFEVLLMEGDPRPVRGAGAATRVKERVLRRFPVLDSSLRAYARVRGPRGRG